MTRKNITWALVLQVISLLFIITAFGVKNARIETLTCKVSEQQATIDSLQNELERRQVDWDKLITAIAWQESRWDDNAVGKTNDAGYLQLTPVYVRDVNRILGENRYKLDDRFDRDKSIEMFNIYQSHYNAEHDMHFAIKLHNPGAGRAYHSQIIDKYNELLVSEQS